MHAAPRSALAKPASVLPVSVPHRDIPTFEINLDLAPEQRYLPLFAEGLGFNATVWKFWEQYFARDFALRDALYVLYVIAWPKTPSFRITRMVFNRLYDYTFTI